MASAAALQYPLPAGPQAYASPTSFPRAAPFSGGASYASNAASFSTPPLSQTLPYSRPPMSRLDSPTSSNTSPGAVAAARSMADHAKLYKKSSVGSSKSNSRTGRSLNPSYGQSPSVASSDNAYPQRSMAKDRFKSNFKKLTQQKGEDKQPTLDLSQTAEENEKRSGLGIYSQEPSSPSLGQFNFASPATDLGYHSRTVSHGSQYSTGSGPFKPSAPFVIPMRQTPRPRTPPISASYSTSVISSGDPYLEGLSNLSHEVTFETPIDESPTAATRHGLRVNTSDSNSPPRFDFTSKYPTASQTNFASPSLRSQRILTRSRRNTNQSSDTAMTSKSRTSIDRAFSFVTRSASGTEKERDDPMDPITRAASIQAARQAFQEKEEAKAKKYELRAQRAAEKAQRKREATGLGRSIPGNIRSRKRSDGQASLGRARTDLRTTTAPPAIGEKEAAEIERTGTEYVDMPAGPAPEKGDKVLQDRRRERKKPTKATTVKNRYLRFLSWIRTKLLNLGRRR